MRIGDQELKKLKLNWNKMTINIAETHIQLLAQKAIFICERRILVISDMHLGKLLHFRKHGIFIPSPTLNPDLKRMISLIDCLNPLEVVFLGDLFHSDKNSEYDSFISTINLYPHIQFTLTRGNHDIIPEEMFTTRNISVVVEKILESNIILRHQLPKELIDGCFYIIGHIHPGYRLQIRGRQTFRLPCFHQGANSLTLPAFGTHTGLFIPDFLYPDKVYVIMNDTVLKITQ